MKNRRLYKDIWIQTFRQKLAPSALLLDTKTLSAVRSRPRKLAYETSCISRAKPTDMSPSFTDKKGQENG